MFEKGLKFGNFKENLFEIWVQKVNLLVRIVSQIDRLQLNELFISI